ncbi:diguanylate cyclase domain-containing protein [Palleronia sp.]|uniref:diguanylate cyclase domain-containing protein n=1 Tax=Palleronia sp. TaxID=1940284 RepID=UPI0035C8469C
MAGNQTVKHLRNQLIASILLLAVFAALPLLIVGKNSVGRIDSAAAEREKAQTVAAVTRRLDDLPVEQRSATVWDEAVVKVEDNDADWMDNNLGIWMHEYFGHDASFVLDPSLDPIYAAVDRERRAPETFDAVASQVLPLAERVRDVVLAGDRDLEEVSKSAYAALEGGPAVVSVIPIIPDTENLDLAPQDTHLHVAVDYLDAAYVESVTHGLALSDPVIAGPEVTLLPESSIAFENDEGAVVARLGWTPSRPARGLVAALLPLIVLWLLGGTIIVLSLTRRLIRTTEKLQQSEAHARYLAFHDPLTRLPNRALFEDRLNQALATIVRGGPPVTLLMLDLDRFKNVNDTLGHPAGDEMIRQVGARIQSRIRRSDTAARLGGDEFAVILVGEIEGGDLDAFCEDLIAEISRPYDLFGNPAHVSASVGACRAEEGNEDPDELVRRADVALYHAKGAGRAQHCLFSDDIDTRAAVTLG